MDQESPELVKGPLPDTAGGALLQEDTAEQLYMELQASQVKEAALRQWLDIPAALTTHPSYPSQFRAYSQKPCSCP